MMEWGTRIPQIRLILNMGQLEGFNPTFNTSNCGGMSFDVLAGMRRWATFAVHKKMKK